MASLRHRRPLFRLFISIKTGEKRLLRRDTAFLSLEGVLSVSFHLFRLFDFDLGLEPASLGVVSVVLTDGASDDDLGRGSLANMVRSSSFALSVTISVRRDCGGVGEH